MQRYLQLLNIWKGAFAQTEVTIANLMSDAATNIGTAISSVWTIMTANPLLTLFVGATIISLGFAFFRKAKRAAR